MSTKLRLRRIESTAAPSASFLRLRPMNGAAAIAAPSVTRTSSSAMLRSIGVPRSRSGTVAGRRMDLAAIIAASDCRRRRAWPRLSLRGGTISRAVIFLSDFLRADVVDVDQRTVGSVRDLIVRMGEPYPVVTAVAIRGREQGAARHHRLGRRPRRRERRAEPQRAHRSAASPTRTPTRRSGWPATSSTSRSSTPTAAGWSGSTTSSCSSRTASCCWSGVDIGARGLLRRLGVGARRAPGHPPRRPRLPAAADLLGRGRPGAQRRAQRAAAHQPPEAQQDAPGRHRRDRRAARRPGPRRHLRVARRRDRGRRRRGVVRGGAGADPLAPRRRARRRHPRGDVARRGGRPARRPPRGAPRAAHRQDGGGRGGGRRGAAGLRGRHRRRPDDHRVRRRAGDADRPADHRQAARARARRGVDLLRVRRRRPGAPARRPLAARPHRRPAATPRSRS